ncbi:MAG: (d)CMP kinase [Pseudomonadota bacterium]
MIIAVDGASGTGKSTICKMVARKLNMSFLDTGSIYRSVALVVKEKNTPLDNNDALKKLCLSLKLRFEFQGDDNHIYLAERDISEEIRTPEVSMLASQVSSIPVVRASLLEMQRRFAKDSKKRGVIIDGRDIGTVVFPDANLKLFFTASNEVRAKRRYDELKAKGMKVDYNEVLKDTLERDKRDTEREISPLRKAYDAVEINTDGMSIKEVNEQVKKLILERLK